MFYHELFGVSKNGQLSALKTLCISAISDLCAGQIWSHCTTAGQHR